MAERPSSKSHFRWIFALATLTLLALAIRFWQLDYHSLWFDETMSVFWARQPAGEILDVGLHLVRDKHPPVYYLLLHLWMHLFGDGEIAMRSLSVVLGALLPPALALLGAQLFGRRAGLLAGLFAALNPMLTWYSQEARMFGPATTLAVLAMLCLVRALQRADWRWWAGYVALSLAGLYAYLFIAFLVPVHILYALGWLILAKSDEPHRRMRVFLQALVAFIILVALFAPLAFQALRVGGAEAEGSRPFARALPTMWNLLNAYTVREVPWPAAAKVAIGIIALALLLIGLAAPPARGRLALWLWLLIPLLAGNLLLAVDATVFAETRYFLFLVPALCLAWGSALSWMAQHLPRVGLSVAAGWALVALMALPFLWTPENRRENWRAAAAYVATHAGPEDAILIHPAFVHVAFEYYYRGPLPIFFPFEGKVEDYAQIEGPLQGLTTYTTVWLVTSHDEQPDPQHLVQRWFDERFPIVTEQYPAGVVVRGYATRYRLDKLPAGSQPADIIYAGGLRLAGYTVDQDKLPASDDVYHPPSNWIHVTLYWSTDALLADDMAISLKLVDAMGQVWGDRLVRAGETLQRHPSSRWTPGEIVRHDVDVNLNPITPAGSYHLELIVFDRNGQPWPAVQRPPGEYRVELATITIME